MMMWKKLRRRGRRCCSRRDYGGDEDCDDNLKLKNLTKLDVSVRDVYKLAKVINEYASKMRYTHHSCSWWASLLITYPEREKTKKLD